MGHVAKPVKVNVWVDEGIAQLVEALSVWDQVVTLDSCEAGQGAFAYVRFTTEPVTDLPTVAETLAGYLSRMESCPAVVSVEWAFGGDVPMGKISCPTTDVSSVATHLINPHSCGSVDGTRYTAARS